jgi:hypothetical protein
MLNFNLATPHTQSVTKLDFDGSLIIQEFAADPVAEMTMSWQPHTPNIR